MYVYIYILQKGISVDRKRLELQVCLSAEDAKNVSWPWLSPL